MKLKDDEGTKAKILGLLTGGPLGYLQLKNSLEISDPVLQRHLRDLLQSGLIVKVGPRGPYELTDKGLTVFEGLVSKKETELESSLKMQFSSLEEWFADRFTRFLIHLDLWYKKVTPGRVLATLNLYPAYVFIKSVVSPGEEAKKYNNFLASVYVNSVDEKARQVDAKLLAMGQRPVFIQAFWKACSPRAWRNLEEPLPGYRFNFVKAYENALTHDIKGILVKARPDIPDTELKILVFARLKVCSHPIPERRGIIKEIWQK